MEKESKRLGRLKLKYTVLKSLSVARGQRDGRDREVIEFGIGLKAIGTFHWYRHR